MSKQNMKEKCKAMQSLVLRYVHVFMIEPQLRRKRQYKHLILK